MYRVTENGKAQGYSDEFILACLVSRTLNYVSMKRFGEVDPARAFAKLTHGRIVEFPIPRLDSDQARGVATAVKEAVLKMLAAPQQGGVHDHQIELALRGLWGLTPEEGRYINGSFSGLPDGQAVRDLFPDGAPSPIAFPGTAGLDATAGA
jgi:hypothetical protein